MESQMGYIQGSKSSRTISGGEINGGFSKGGNNRGSKIKLGMLGCVEILLKKFLEILKQIKLIPFFVT